MAPLSPGRYGFRGEVRGDRAVIRWRASQDALVSLRRYLMLGAAAFAE